MGTWEADVAQKIGKLRKDFDRFRAGCLVSAGPAITVDTAANVPTSPSTKDLFISTTTAGSFSANQLYRYNGSSWVAVA